MLSRSILLATLPALTLVASCGAKASVDSPAEARPVAGATMLADVGPFAVSEHGRFDAPWAAAFEPGTGRLFITEKGGQLKLFDPASGAISLVSGVPQVDAGGQGGLGDIAFGPDYASSGAIYLSWVEAGDGDTRGAVVGRGTLDCSGANCAIRGLEVIWRQAPKVTGRGHFSHRLAFSPDGKYLFVASGDRQKMQPAQDTTNTLGSIVRLNPDGTAAAGNPLADRPAPSDELWSWGHRNILGLEFAPDGRLWEVEHGPAGGDELNLVSAGANYGWPLVSDGDHYDGEPIPDNSTRPDLAQSALTWNPVIAPGGMVLYHGALFPGWKGDALMAGLSSNALVHVRIDGASAREIARYDFGERLRGVVEAPDGALWVLEDGSDARLLRLTPKAGG